jgi:hypothetical protein
MARGRTVQRVLVRADNREGVLFKLQAAAGNGQRAAVKLQPDGLAVFRAAKNSDFFFCIRQNALPRAFNDIVTVKTNA